VSARFASACLLFAGALAGARTLAASSGRISEPLLALSLSSLAIELVILALALGAALLAPGAPRERLGLVRGRLGALETAVLVAGTLGLSHALDALLELSGLFEQSGLADFARSAQGARGLPLAAGALAIGLAPALAEELLCRGVLQRSLLPRLGAAPAVLLAALVFSALHVDPIHAAFAFPLGAYLGVAGYWSGSVLAPIACHAVNNLVALGVAAQRGAAVSATPADVAAGALLAAAALAWVGRRGGRRLQPAAGSVDG
jgi:membrane protease YdiL (CAAX protease family)